MSFELQDSGSDVKVGTGKAVLDEQSFLLGERAASLEAAYQEKFEDFVLGQRQRKHAVAQVLNEIMPTVQNIKDFIDNNESVSKDSVVSQRSGKNWVSICPYLLSKQTR